MSGLEALSLVGTAIEAVEACVEIYRAANDARGLHKSFQAAESNLPLVLEILRNCERAQQQHLTRVQTVDEDEDEDCGRDAHPRTDSANAGTAVSAVLKRCQENAEKIKQQFEKAAIKRNASTISRYAAAFRSHVSGRGQRVNQLTQEILESLQLLHTHNYFSRVIVSYDAEVSQALQRLTNGTTSSPTQSRLDHSTPRHHAAVQNNFVMYGGSGNRQLNAEVLYVGDVGHHDQTTKSHRLLIDSRAN